MLDPFLGGPARTPPPSRVLKRSLVQPKRLQLQYHPRCPPRCRILHDHSFRDGYTIRNTSIDPRFAVGSSFAEAEAAEMKKHEKVVKLGVPADAEPPLLGQQVRGLVHFLDVEKS